MAGGINFSGLATGMDTGSIIDKLVSLERARVPLLEKERSNYQSQLSVMSDLVAKLKALQTAALSLDTQSELSAFTAASTDEAQLTATASGAAAPGQYDLNVALLAKAEQTRIPSDSAGFSGDSLSFADDGILRIAVAGVTADIAYSSTEKLTDLAAAINASAVGAKVTATVVKDGNSTPGYFLLVHGRETGAANAISFEDRLADDSGPQNQLTFHENQAAQDAKVSFGGIDVYRPSNTISDLVPGVTLKLLGTQGASAGVTVSRDLETEGDNLQKLVDAYNAVASVLAAQLGYTGTTKGGNTLFADATLRGLQQRMGGVLARAYGGISPRTLGLALAKDGTLAFDRTQFESAAARDHGQVIDLVAGEGGLARGISDLAFDYVKAGSSTSTHGLLLSRQEGIQDRIDDLGLQIEQLGERAEKVGDRLRAIFTRLEESVSLIKSQGDQLLAALNR